MNRLYVVEPSVTCTGAKADNRLALKAQEVESFARTLAVRLGAMAGAADAEARMRRGLRQWPRTSDDIAAGPWSSPGRDSRKPSTCWRWR